MARSLRVEIIGDASSLESALSRAGSTTASFGGRLAGIAKTALLVGGAAGIGAVAVGLDKSVKAALAAQQSTARLDQAFKNVGLSAKASAGQIDQAEASSRKLGFTDTDVRSSLGSLIVATGDVKKAMNELSTAQDVARFKGIGLTDATKMLTMAQTGSQRAAKQLGITVIPLTTNYDALKASNVDLTTATGHLEAAHAKLLDKMATGQAVIAAVNEKVHGQGQAFADTAAGGMEQFHAQLEHLEVTIGEKLLPTLVSVVGWVNDHWPQIAQVVGEVFTKIGAYWAQYGQPAFDAVVAAGRVVVGYVRDHWPEISATISSVMRTAHAIISQTVAVVEALWRQFGSTIISVLKTAFETVGRVLHDAVGVVSGVFALIGDLIHGRWSKIWGDLKKIVGNALDGLYAVLKGAVSIAFHLAVSIAEAIIGGILSGLGDLAAKVGHAIGHALRGGVDYAKQQFLFAKSPSKLTRDELGIPMAQGIIVGFKAGMEGFPGIVSDTLDSAFVAGRKKVNDWFAILLKDARGVLKDMQDVVDSLFAINIPRAAATGGSVAGSVGKGIVERSLGGGGTVGAVIPHAATGGYVETSGVAVIHKGETIVPAGRGGGNVYVTVQGALLGSTIPEVAATLRRELLRTQMRNGTLGFT